MTACGAGPVDGPRHGPVRWSLLIVRGRGGELRCAPADVHARGSGAGGGTGPGGAPPCRGPGRAGRVNGRHRRRHGDRPVAPARAAAPNGGATRAAPPDDDSGAPSRPRPSRAAPPRGGRGRSAGRGEVPGRDASRGPSPSGGPSRRPVDGRSPRARTPDHASQDIVTGAPAVRTQADSPSAASANPSAPCDGRRRCAADGPLPAPVRAVEAGVGRPRQEGRLRWVSGGGRRPRGSRCTGSRHG